MFENKILQQQIVQIYIKIKITAQMRLISWKLQCNGSDEMKLCGLQVQVYEFVYKFSLEGFSSPRTLESSHQVK